MTGAIRRSSTKLKIKRLCPAWHWYTPATVPRDHIRECVAFHQFENDGRQAASLFQAVHRRDVRVVERGEGFGLRLESSETVRISPLLQRHSALQFVEPVLDHDQTGRVAGATSV